MVGARAKYGAGYWLRNCGDRCRESWLRKDWLVGTTLDESMEEEQRRMEMNTLLGGRLDRSLEHYPANARRIWYLALTVIATITLY